MADTNKIDELLKEKEKESSKEPTKPKELNFEKALVHLANIRSYLEPFAGKTGYNPFIYIAQHIAPLEAAYEKGDRSEELYNKMLAVKQEEPVIQHIKLSRLDETTAMKLPRK